MSNIALVLAAASILGVFVIGIVGDMIDVGFTVIKSINSNMLDSAVHVRGVIQEARPFSAGVKMLIEQDGWKIQVVYFTDETIGRRGMCADVIGEVKTYESSLQIEAKELTVFFC
jgi:RecJ-like exonuclease